MKLKLVFVCLFVFLSRWTNHCNEATKCFERLIKNFIRSSLPSSVHPLQFGNCPNRSTDVLSHVLHAPSPIWTLARAFIRLLFADYSSAFNTITSETSQWTGSWAELPFALMDPELSDYRWGHWGNTHPADEHSTSGPPKVAY